VRENAMGDIYSTSLGNNFTELSALLRDLNMFLKPHRYTMKFQNAVNLVLEEALGNIINHGYNDNGKHAIDVRVEVTPNEVALRIEDAGKAFNPLTIPRPDRSKPATERIEDGLGIHLVRNFMQSMSYRRYRGKNVFEIWIKPL
jgi:anti-sigma regulatory factor (Ser/Thr protein kinase)